MSAPPLSLNYYIKIVQENFRAYGWEGPSSNKITFALKNFAKSITVWDIENIE